MDPSLFPELKSQREAELVVLSINRSWRCSHLPLLEQEGSFSDIHFLRRIRYRYLHHPFTSPTPADPILTPSPPNSGSQRNDGDCGPV